MPRPEKYAALIRRLRSEAAALDDHPAEQIAVLYAADALTHIATEREIKRKLADNRRGAHMGKNSLCYKTGKMPTPWYDLVAFSVVNAPTVLPAGLESILREAMDAVLSERQQLVVLARFRDNQTLESISLQMNISRERVRQIQNHAIRKLRRPDTLNAITRGAWPAIRSPLTQADMFDHVGTRTTNALLRRGLDLPKLLELYRAIGEDRLYKTLRDLNQIGPKGTRAVINFIKTGTVEELSAPAAPDHEERQRHAYKFLDRYGIGPDDDALLWDPRFDDSLETRATNCLVRNGIKTIRQLLNLYIEQPRDQFIRELMALRNFGLKSLDNILKFIEEEEEDEDV